MEQNLFEADLAHSEPAVTFMSPLLKTAYLIFLLKSRYCEKDTKFEKKLPFLSSDKIRRAEYLFGMLGKWCLFLQLVHPKQIFGPSYFVRALVMSNKVRHFFQTFVVFSKYLNFNVYYAISGIIFHLN